MDIKIECCADLYHMKREQTEEQLMETVNIDKMLEVIHVVEIN